MGEINNYDERQNLFSKGKGPRLSRETIEVMSLKPGEYWSEPHECESAGMRDCTLGSRLYSVIRRHFGAGNYATSHNDGMIAILRKV